MGKVIDQLCSAAYVKDAQLTAIDPGGLADRVEAQLQPPALADPTQAWGDEKSKLLALIPQEDPQPDFSSSLGDALDKWMKAATADKMDENELLSRSWTVLGILAGYRAEVSSKIKDRNLAAQFRAIFDRIALTVATTLRGVMVEGEFVGGVANDPAWPFPAVALPPTNHPPITRDECHPSATAPYFV